MTQPDFDKLAAKVAKAAGFKPDQIGYIQISGAAKDALHKAYNAGLEAAIKATGMGGLGRIAVRAKKLPTGGP